MKDNNCPYCAGGEALANFGIKICDLNAGQLVLFKEQSHPGRCIVAYKDHVNEIVDISDDERNAFMADVAHVSKALHAAFKPDKVNYGAYSDTLCHLHVHMVPKYELPTTDYVGRGFCYAARRHEPAGIVYPAEQGMSTMPLSH